MKKIELTQGKFAMVDDDDFERVSQYKWQLTKGNSTFYGTRTVKRKNIYLHRFILDVKDRNIFVDHKDHDGLNNMRSNLRLCNARQNCANRLKSIGLSSKFKGVTWDKKRRKWKSKIKINYKTINLGCFNTEIEAAISYNNAARLHFGEFAHLNIIERHGKGTQTALAI